MTATKLALKGDPKFIPVMMAVDREVSALEKRKVVRTITEDMTLEEAAEAFRRTLRGEDSEED